MHTFSKQAVDEVVVEFNACRINTSEATLWPEIFETYKQFKLYTSTKEGFCACCRAGSLV